MSVVEANDNNFEAEVLKASQPVLVDFWAEWCGPCKMIAPIVEDIAAECQDQLKVVKVNVDEAQNLAGKFGITSIPTLMIFKGGEVVDAVIGAVPKEQILDKVKPHLS